PSQVAPDVATALAIYRGRAWLALGRPERGLAVLDEAPRASTDSVSARRKVEVLRGRLHLAIARRHLADARASLPGELDPLDRVEAGEILLANAGEALDPETFGRRR